MSVARDVMVGPSGLEPPTSRLSGVRSNQLSYGPTVGASVGGGGPAGHGHALPHPELPESVRLETQEAAAGHPHWAGRPASRLQLQAPEREITNSARTRKPGSLT